MINISYNAERLVVYINHEIFCIKYYGELDLVLKGREDLIAQLKELGHEVQ